jgi:hypothetical protein
MDAQTIIARRIAQETRDKSVPMKSPPIAPGHAPIASRQGRTDDAERPWVELDNWSQVI